MCHKSKDIEREGATRAKTQAQEGNSDPALSRNDPTDHPTKKRSNTGASPGLASNNTHFFGTLFDGLYFSFQIQELPKVLLPLSSASL